MSRDYSAPPEFQVLRPEDWNLTQGRITSVLVVAWTPEGRIVAIRNKRGWDIPGGHCEEEDSGIEATGIREIYEEAKVRIESPTLCCVLSSQAVKGERTFLPVLASRTRQIDPFESDSEVFERAFLYPADFLEQYQAGDKQLMQSILGFAEKSIGTKPLNRNIRIEWDNPRYCGEFIRLNEDWIGKYFVLEESDHRLARNPFQIVENGGHILCLVQGDRVLGVCALVRESDEEFQLARLAVDPQEQGQGLGELLVRTVIHKAQERGASTLYLLTNTTLEAAYGLYQKLGFQMIAEGRHPVYARCNRVMALDLKQGETRA